MTSQGRLCCRALSRIGAMEQRPAAGGDPQSTWVIARDTAGLSEISRDRSPGDCALQQPPLHDHLMAPSRPIKHNHPSEQIQFLKRPKGALSAGEGPALIVVQRQKPRNLITDRYVNLGASGGA